MIKAHHEWANLLGELAWAQRPSRVYVMGNLDSGKSTLSSWLVRELSNLGLAALVDCDPGQAVLGPPSTIAMRLMRRGRWQGKSLCKFVGSTSPVGHLLQTLVGIQRLGEVAEDHGAGWTIFDSCGLASGALGRDFQYQTIDLIQPAHVIALAQGDELDDILRLIRPRGIRIWPMTVSPDVKARSTATRTACRQLRLRDYFRGSRNRKLKTAELGILSRGDEVGRLDLTGRLIGLCDADGFVVCLAIVSCGRLADGELGIVSPRFEQGKIAIVHVGSLLADRSGNHSRV